MSTSIINKYLNAAKFVAENVMLESGVFHTPYVKVFNSNPVFSVSYGDYTMTFSANGVNFLTIQVKNIIQTFDNQKYMVIEDHENNRIHLWFENGWSGMAPVNVEAQALRKAIATRKNTEREELIKALTLAETGKTVEFNRFYISAEWWNDPQYGEYVEYYIEDDEELLFSSSRRERVMLFFGLC